MDNPATEFPAPRVLLVADRPLRSDEIRRVADVVGAGRALLLDLSPDERVTAGTLPLCRLRLDELLEVDAYHRAVVEFLDRWPQQTLIDGRPFGDVFRHTTGDSVWWTGPGSLRHPFSGPLLPHLRVIWIARAAIERERPSEVIVCLRDGRVARLVTELCRALDVIRKSEAPANLQTNVIQSQDEHRSQRVAWVGATPEAEPPYERTPDDDRQTTHDPAFAGASLRSRPGHPETHLHADQNAVDTFGSQGASFAGTTISAGTEAPNSNENDRDQTICSGSAGASPSPVALWFVCCVLSLIALAIWIAVRAVYAWLVTQPRRKQHPGPTIVMSGWYPNHVRDDADGTPQVVYWQRLAQTLRQRHPDIRVRYLLHTTTFRLPGWKRLLRPFYTGWHRLRRIDDLLPLTQCHPRLGTFLSAAAHQLRLMRVYARFERGSSLQTAPRFAGVDVSPLLLPHLRSAVASMAKWSRNVSATADSLRAAGDVRGVLVHEEFYPKGMLTIAAARSLGIPTLGVQHGQVGPQHAVYMPPPGHIVEGPCPDWFAAYGESVRQTLSDIGAYPADRIRVVGAPRFDELATHSPDRDACRRLFGWDERQPVVLVTTETFALSSPIVRALASLASQHSGWRIVIKLHPHEREPHRYADLLDEAGTANIEVVSDRLAERLAACDVLVTGYSTTAMEGLLVGRPVICADFTTWPDRYPFVIEGSALPARSGEELRAAITSLIEHLDLPPQRDEFLRRHLGPTVDGRAAETFVQTIDELLLRGGQDRR